MQAELDLVRQEARRPGVPGSGLRELLIWTLEKQARRYTPRQRLEEITFTVTVCSMSVLAAIPCPKKDLNSHRNAKSKLRKLKNPKPQDDRKELPLSPEQMEQFRQAQELQTKAIQQKEHGVK